MTSTFVFNQEPSWGRVQDHSIFIPKEKEKYCSSTLRHAFFTLPFTSTVTFFVLCLELKKISIWQAKMYILVITEATMKKINVLFTISQSAGGSLQPYRRVWLECFQTQCGISVWPGIVVPWSWAPHAHIFPPSLFWPKQANRITADT